MIDYLSQDRVQHFIQEHQTDDPVKLMLSHYTKEWAHFDKIVEQIRSRQKAKNKLNEWLEKPGILFPPSLSVEQSSSELTANHKCSLVSGGGTMIDLTGGFGIDTFYLSRRFDKTHYVERSAWLCDLAKHNFNKLEANIDVICGEASEILEKSSKVNLIYIDPARRDVQQKKVFHLSDCSPDVSVLEAPLLEKADEVLIKLSPFLDIKSVLRALNHIHQVFVVAVKNEVKELLVLLNKETQDDPLVRCVNLNEKGADEYEFHFKQEAEADIPFSNIKRYLYEPNAAILKAGAFKMIGKSYQFFKLHENTHLYTSDHLDASFPGRIFDVIQPLPIDRKKLGKIIPEKQAHITIRNFPSSVAQIRKKLALKDGGDAYVFACTGQEGKLFLLTKKIKQHSQDEWG